MSWGLAQYSAALDEQSRRRRQEESDQTAEMERKLPEYLDLIPQMEKTLLLEHFITWRDRSHNYMMPRRQKQLLRFMRMRARREILRRMER